jgi:hypothetical protein
MLATHDELAEAATDVLNGSAPKLPDDLSLAEIPELSVRPEFM